jgi:hypothetical protein
MFNKLKLFKKNEKLKEKNEDMIFNDKVRADVYEALSEEMSLGSVIFITTLHKGEQGDTLTHKMHMRKGFKEDDLLPTLEEYKKMVEKKLKIKQIDV